MSNDFIVGGKVECISNNRVSDGISLYKVYEVLEVLENTILIKDDYDMQMYYTKDNFKPFKENVIGANSLQIKDSDNNVFSGISPTGEFYKVGTKENVENQFNIIDANTQIIQLPSSINVLGTTYTIEVTSIEDDSCLEGIYGYCDFLTKSIVIRELKPLDYQGNIDAINAQYKTNLRHELMHAFLYESGLDSSTLDNWARNEEMVDYMALQLPKIFKVMKECAIIE